MYHPKITSAGTTHSLGTIRQELLSKNYSSGAIHLAGTSVQELQIHGSAKRIPD